MEYLFHEGNLINEFLKVNNIAMEDLDTSTFFIDKENKHLVEFKEKLLSLKDHKVLLIGDYDCDGICSTAIIKKLLIYLNIEHNFFIPSRGKDGYGLNENMVKVAKDNNFEAIIAVDNGVSASEAISMANECGIKVLIIDHHEYSKTPDCYGFIHPSLLDKPYKDLSAGGLSYLISSLFYDDELSLVYGGLAVEADMVGVLGFNRYLMKEMLKILKKGNIYQINLLNEGLDYDYESLSFNVIPKINAVSRMDYNPNVLVKYLLADKLTCLKTIDQINMINEERKTLTSKLSKSSFSNIIYNKNLAIVVSEDYSEGICGLIANRLLHVFNKPLMVLSKKDGVLKGSCRSIDEFNLYEYLLGAIDIFDSFGGHEKACGVTLKEENLDRLIKYLDTAQVNINKTVNDVYIVPKEELSYDLYLKLEDLKPFGIDLKEPLLAIKDIDYTNKQLIKGKYPKYFINNNVSAICFDTNLINKQFSMIVGHLKKDNYHKFKSSFLIEDLL